MTYEEWSKNHPDQGLWEYKQATQPWLTGGPDSNYNTDFLFANAFTNIKGGQANPDMGSTAPVNPFSSSYQIGSADYSRDLANYLNSLSIAQLGSLNMDISGLARSDLSTLDIGNYQDYSPDFIKAISKYRNTFQSNDYGAGHLPTSGFIQPGFYSDYSPGGYIDMWSTRNDPTGSDLLYRHTADGGFELVPYNAPAGGFIRDYFPSMVMAGLGYGIGGALAGGATAVGAGAGTTTTGGGITPLVSGSGADIAGLMGAESSLLGGSIGGYGGALASVGGSIPASMTSLPTIHGAGYSGADIAGLQGAEALATGGNAGGYLGAIGQSNPSLWATIKEYANQYGGDIAKKLTSEGIKSLMGSGGAITGTSGMSGGWFSGGFGGTPQSFSPVASTPWQFNPIQTQKSALGYIDRLRS